MKRVLSVLAASACSRVRISSIWSRSSSERCSASWAAASGWEMFSG
jgi:hypothetical protein